MSLVSYAIMPLYEFRRVRIEANWRKLNKFGILHPQIECVMLNIELLPVCNISYKTLLACKIRSSHNVKNNKHPKKTHFGSSFVKPIWSIFISFFHPSIDSSKLTQNPYLVPQTSKSTTVMHNTLLHIFLNQIKWCLQETDAATQL